MLPKGSIGNANVQNLHFKPMSNDETPATNCAVFTTTLYLHFATRGSLLISSIFICNCTLLTKP